MLNITSKLKILFFLIIFFGLFLRLGLVNSEDLWFDEILTFSISSNEISIYESFSLSNFLDNTPFLNILIFKIFFNIFGYNLIYAKIFLVFLSFTSVITTSYISYLISKNSSFIIVSFLTSFNIFLISFSSEFRVFTIFYLISSLSIIFFLRAIQNNTYKSNFYFLFFTIFNTLLHPFSFIILFSFIVFLILNYKKNFFFKKKIINSLAIILSIYLIYYFFYLKNIYLNNNIDSFGPNWITSPTKDFYYHYFFSNFFGSRIMGVLFIVLFIFLIYKNFNKKNIINAYTFLIILTILSYVIPLLYGQLFKHILIPRYIIFVLIPIIIIISNYLLELKHSNLKKTLIFIVIVSTLVNLFNEDLIKKVYDRNYFDKPQFSKAINIIGNSDHVEYLIKFNFNENKNKEEYIIRVYSLYLDYLGKKQKLKINNIDQSFIKKKGSKFWIICDFDINREGCEINFNSNINILKNINLHKLNLKLVEFI